MYTILENTTDFTDIFTTEYGGLLSAISTQDNVDNTVKSTRDNVDDTETSTR